MSDNGLTWTQVAVTENEWNGVIWSPSLGLFVAVADSGTGNRVMTSTNGINWIDGSITDRTWKTITWSEELGIFLVVARDGYTAYSSDGFTWIESVLTGDNRGVVWSAELGIFVISGKDDLIYTSSLKNRPPSNTNLFDSEFNSINESGEWTFKTLTTTDLVVGTTNIITELGTKQATITSATDLTSNSLTTIGNGTIGGNLTISGSLTNRNQPCFKATTTQSLQPSVDTNIIFNNPIIDVEGGYNSSTGEYTIPKDGNWYFYYSFQSNGVAFKVQLQQDGVARDQVFTDLTPTADTDIGCKGMVIIPCVVNDVIQIRVKTGSVGIENGGFFEFHSFGGFLIG